MQVDHYLQVEYVNRGAYWLFADDRPGECSAPMPLRSLAHLASVATDDNPNINGIITFANALIAFQNIVRGHFVLGSTFGAGA